MYEGAARKGAPPLPTQEPLAATDYDYRSGRAKILQRALRIVGALSVDEPMTAEMEAQAGQALSELLREWENRDVCLWKLQQITIATVAGTASYTISTDPAVIDIEQAVVVDSGYDYPLEVVRWRDYNADIPDKTAAGRPSCITVQRTTGNPSAVFYPVPDAAYSVRILAVCRMKDYDTSASTPDFPVDFEKALSFGLAKELSFEYPGTQGFRDSIAIEAERAFAIATAANRESSDDSGGVESGYPRQR